MPDEEKLVDLTFVETVALVEELYKRCDSLLVLMHDGHPDKAYGVNMHRRGDPYAILGAMTWARGRVVASLDSVPVRDS